MSEKSLAFAIVVLFVGAGAVSAFNVNLVNKSNLMNRGNILYVGGSGPGNYSNIQDAIDNTSSGDTVFVYSGIYYENVEIYTSIDLIGESRYDVIVDGGSGEQVFHVTTDYVNISEFSITNGNHGIHLEGSSNTNINYCIAYENTYGITPRNSPFTTITNCEAHNNEQVGIIVLSSPNSNFNNNILFDTQSGIYMTNSPNCIINNCDAYNITMEALSSGGSGFYLENSPQCIIENCNSYNCTDYGIYLFYSSECNITNCDFYNNTWNPDAQFPSSYHSVGIKIVGSTDCVITDCSIYNNDNGIYFEEDVSNCILRDNIFYNNVEGSFDISAYYPENFYLDVDTSNTIDGKPIIYIIGESDLTFDETDDVGYLGLVSCSNIAVMNIDIPGILMVDTSYSSITNVHSHDCKKGIYFYFSPNCSIIDSEGYNNRYGIYGSSENIINCSFYNNDYGIYLEREYEEKSKGAVNGGNVTGCKSYLNEIGFYEQKGSHITDCEIFNNSEYGFYISCEAEEPEFGSVLRDNSFHDNSYNFYAEGYEPSGYAYQDIDDSNMVNGKPILYITEEQGQVIDGSTTDIGLVVLISCSDMTVQNVETSYNKQGLLLVDTSNSIITNCDFYNNKDGIWLYVYSINNQIINCRCFNNERGIASQEEASYNEINNCHLFNNSQFGYWSQVNRENKIIGCTINDNGYAYSEEIADYPYSLQYGGPGVMIHYITPDNVVENCAIYNNYEGIYVFEKSDSQTIRNCQVYNNTINGIGIRKEKYCLVENCTTYENKYGISLEEESSYNEIMKCDSYNNEYGIYVTISSNSNKIYHNNFIDNTQNAYDECTNIWDNGYSDPFNALSDGGNYWSDYTEEDSNHGPNQDIPGADGIGDIPYNVPGDGNQDGYPFIKPDGWEIQDQTPNVTILNPKEGYFHLSGIPLFPTIFNVFGDTLAIGGFRIRPIIINVTDDIDESADLIVKIFLNGMEKGNATYYPDSGVFKWKWTGKAFGTYNLTITAEDSSHNIGKSELDVWNFCFLP